MTLTLLEFGLPLDICLIIEKISYKENLKLVFEELIKYIDTNANYKMHEFYFIQILPFIKRLIIPRPTFNDNFIFKIFWCGIKYNNHCFLYKDHMNHYIYQKQKYDIYYSHSTINNTI